ncbi:MAG TPA: 3-isopropylmalate dehydrogenase [Terriglobales bacterium]|jgi:3-isopropylmalate dehydrogenase|nr:3-isopropylmalate dehydrogenase [Terriglobales bacterium]
MKLNITVLPGDGVGPEVTREAVRVLRTVLDLYGYEGTLEEHLIGGAAIRQAGVPLPEATVRACMNSQAVLLGAVGGPEFDSLPAGQRPESGLLALRQALGGYANLRPAIAYNAIADCSPLRPEIIKGADVLIVRELLGGIYFAEPRGFESGPCPSAHNTMRYSEAEIERVANVAFQQAQKRRRKVTSVDKANVLETSRLWRQTVTRVSRDYPEVKLEHMYVDACAMRLMTHPGSFDVIVTENLFGDILSDEAAVISGSLGMLASVTIGGKVDLYEPVHGSAPDIAGRGIANPLGAIASAAMLLRHSAGLEQGARDIEDAIREVLDAGHRTADLSPQQANKGRGRRVVSTAEMGALVESAVADVADRRRAYHAV